MKTSILFLALISAMMPVITQKTGLSKKHPLEFKMLCVFLFLAVGMLSALKVGTFTAYSICILSALVSGGLGDFFLSYKKNKFFMLGLAFFAIGHLIYSYTFLCQGSYSASTYMIPVAIVTVVLTLSLFIFSKLRMKLGGKQIPFTVYGTVLAFFFTCAVASGLVAIASGNIAFGLCLITGGILFSFSDLLIGAKFGGMRRPKIFHYFVSYTYFTAQTLFALSILLQHGGL